MEGVFWTELISAIEAIRLPRFQVADGVEWGTSGHTQVCVAEVYHEIHDSIALPPDSSSWLFNWIWKLPTSCHSLFFL